MVIEIQLFESTIKKNVLDDKEEKLLLISI